jgi:hypothetical protein
MRGVVVLLAALALAGCGAGAELARDADEQGRPCVAASLEPGNESYAADCSRQQDAEPGETEARGGEATR